MDRRVFALGASDVSPQPKRQLFFPREAANLTVIDDRVSWLDVGVRRGRPRWARVSDANRQLAPGLAEEVRDGFVSVGSQIRYSRAPVVNRFD
jgi:hypothetical protein